MLLLILSFFALLSFAQGAIIPTDTYTDNIIFNGKASTQQVMTFLCSDTNSQGQFIVGNYSLTVVCNPPVSNYDLTEIARIPSEVLSLDQLACLVSNQAAFQQTLLNNAQTALDQALSATRRRLLQIDPVAFGLAIYATYQANRAYNLAQEDATNINLLQTQTASLAAQSIQLGGTILSLQTQLNLTNQEITLVANQTNYNTESIEGLKIANEKQINATLFLSQHTDDSLNNLQTMVASNITSLANFVNTQVPNATAQAIGQVYTNLLGITTALRDQLNVLQDYAHTGFSSMTAYMASMEDVQSNRLLLQGITAQVQAAMLAIPDNMFPFVTDPGVVPSVLQGVDLRNLQEEIFLGYRTPQINIAQPYEVHSVQLHFYTDTEFGLKQEIQQGTFTLQLETIALFFGSANCSRSYISPAWSGSLDQNTADGTTCTLYLEIIDSYCQSTVTPKPSWNISDGPKLTTRLCGGGSSFTVSTVIKTFPQYMDYVSTSLCPKRGNDTAPFIAWMTRGDKGGYLYPPSGSQCSNPWDLQSQLTVTSGAGLAQSLLFFVQQAWNLANVDLDKKKQKKFGALPGRVTIDNLPYYHMPVFINKTSGIGSYDGSATPSQCLNAHINAISYETLGVYSMKPSYPAVSRTITVTVQPLNGYTCNDPNLCYPVGVSLIDSDIISQDDSPPPQQPVVFLGSLLPSIVGQQGIYDAPSEELECATNAKANAYKLCYTKFPPGTTTSLTLPEYEAYMGVTYNPEMGQASASDFRVHATFDQQGYPVCANAPQPATNVSYDAHNCQLPFTYQANALPNLLTGTTAYNKPTECVQANTVALFQNFQDSIQTALYGTSALALAQGGTFSFWFKSPLPMSTGNEVIVLEIRGIASGVSKYLRFIVDANGVAASVLSSSATAQTLVWDTRTTGGNGKQLKPVNLRDGVLHQVTWSSSVANYGLGTSVVTYILYVDGVSQGTWTCSSGQYLKSDAAPVYFDSALNIQEQNVLGDIINLGLYNPNAPVFPNSYSCQQAWFNSMCTQTTGEQLAIARQVVTSTSNIICDSSALLVFSTMGFDSLYPQGLAPVTSLFATNFYFSLAFWIRMPNNPSFGSIMVLQNALTRFVVNLDSSSQKLQLYLNNILIAAMLLVDQQSHYIYVTYDGGQARVYLDLALFASPVTVSALSGGTGTVKSLSLPYVNTVKYYAEVSSQEKINTEQACQIDVGVNSLYFQPAIGFCEQSTAHPAFAYCRSSLMCNGWCSAYSAYNSTTHTFQPINYNCDPGRQSPSCLKPCGRTDPATGLCIDLGYVSAPVPLSYMCQLTGNSQVSMNLASNKLTATARRFLYLTTIRIPTGQVSSVIGAAGCPQLQLSTFGNFGLLAVFQNLANQESTIQVFYAPSVYLADPSDNQCDPACCNVAGPGKIISIPSKTSGSLQIPACGNMTISYGYLISVTPVNQYQLCNSLSGDSLAQAVNTGNSQQNANIISTVQTVVDTRALELLGAQTAFSSAILNAFIQYAAANNATSNQLYNLLLLREQVIAAGSVVNFNFTDLPPINITAGVLQNLDAAQQELDKVQQSIDAAKNISGQVAQLNKLITQLAANNTEELNNVLAGLQQTLFNIEAIRAIDPSYDGFGGIEDFGKALGGFVENTAVGIVNAGKDIVSAGLGAILGVGGGIGGFISQLLSTLVYVAIIVGGAWVAYQVYKWYQAREKSKPRKKKQKADDDEEEAGEETAINVHKTHRATTTNTTSTSGRRTAFD